MKGIIAAVCALTLIVSCNAGAMSAGKGPADIGGSAQQKLIAGNQRYADAKLLHPNQSAERRAEIATTQHPFAAIVGCADSRVPPEILFDQGLGDLFVVRLAGNIVDEAALASLEYAAGHLGVTYIMVLGHERCGAVDAALKGGEVPGHIGTLVKAIQPAVDETRNQPGDPLDNAVRANVSMVVQQLKSSEPILNALVEKGDLTIVGAYYDLDDGVVAMLP